MSRIESVARRAAVGHARAASAAESRGDTNAAIDAWTAAAGADPAWAPARVGLGQALLRAGRASDADPVLERAVALAPGDAGAWLALGVARATLGRHDAAIAAGERACTLAPQLAGVHLGQGDVLRVAGAVGFHKDLIDKAVIGTRCAAAHHEAIVFGRHNDRMSVAEGHRRPGERRECHKKLLQ